MNFWDHHKAITCYYELLMSSVCQKYQLRQMEYDILMFLYHNPQYHTAADIVRVRNSTKSHVSTSLKVLEERGLIEKRSPTGTKSISMSICPRRLSRSSPKGLRLSGSLPEICFRVSQSLRSQLVNRHSRRYATTQKNASK